MNNVAKKAVIAALVISLMSRQASAFDLGVGRIYRWASSFLYSQPILSPSDKLFKHTLKNIIIQKQLDNYYKKLSSNDFVLEEVTIKKTKAPYKEIERVVNRLSQQVYNHENKQEIYDITQNFYLSFLTKEVDSDHLKAFFITYLPESLGFKKSIFSQKKHNIKKDLKHIIIDIIRAIAKKIDKNATDKWITEQYKKFQYFLRQPERRKKDYWEKFEVTYFSAKGEISEMLIQLKHHPLLIDLLLEKIAGTKRKPDIDITEEDIFNDNIALIKSKKLSKQYITALTEFDKDDRNKQGFLQKNYNFTKNEVERLKLAGNNLKEPNKLIKDIVSIIAKKLESSQKKSLKQQGLYPKLQNTPQLTDLEETTIVKRIWKFTDNFCLNLLAKKFDADKLKYYFSVYLPKTLIKGTNDKTMKTNISEGSKKLASMKADFIKNNISTAVSFIVTILARMANKRNDSNWINLQRRQFKLFFQNTDKKTFEKLYQAHKAHQERNFIIRNMIDHPYITILIIGIPLIIITGVALAAKNQNSGDSDDDTSDKEGESKEDDSPSFLSRFWNFLTTSDEPEYYQDRDRPSLIAELIVSIWNTYWYQNYYDLLESSETEDELEENLNYVYFWTRESHVRHLFEYHAYRVASQNNWRRPRLYFSTILLS